MTTNSAEDALRAFIDAAVKQDVPAVLGAMLPEALMQVGGLNLGGIGTLKSYEIAARRLAGNDQVFVIRLHADEDVDIELTWRDTGGGWKVAGAARVPTPGQEPAGVFAQLSGGVAPTLNWLNAGTEWGVRAPVGSRGLTLEAINVGSYGSVPEHSTHATQRPRGAAPNSDTPSMGISIFDKAEVWSPIAGELYEEAIQRRWSPSTGIAWTDLPELEPDLERAFCQLCTSLSERQLVANDVPAGWEHHIGYDFHEVKLYLATQIFDAARHVELFRKRALANGGGLGMQSPGNVARLIIDSQSFSEMSLLLHVMVSGQTALWLRVGEAYATNPVDQRIFRLSLQDVSRHIAFGVTHLRYLLQQRPECATELHRYLDKAEGMLVSDDERDGALNDALTVILGRGDAGHEEGARRLRAMKARFLTEYRLRLEYGGLTDRVKRLDPRLAAYAGAA